jgi:hypothetical protein
MTKITQLSQLNFDGTYAYADYLTIWQLDKANLYLFSDLEIDLQEIFAE